MCFHEVKSKTWLHALRKDDIQHRLCVHPSYVVFVLVSQENHRPRLAIQIMEAKQEKFHPLLDGFVVQNVVSIHRDCDPLLDAFVCCVHKEQSLFVRGGGGV